MIEIKKNFFLILVALFLLKFLFLILFSSQYMQCLFIPFVTHFVANLDNPWQYFYQFLPHVEFPYNPLSLYVLSLFSWLFSSCGFTSFFSQNIALKMPSLFADGVITWLLLRMFPQKTKEIIIFYCLSPIILYAVYLHSQLDLIPTAVLFCAVYLLKRRHFYWAALLLGCAASTKLHVVAALPLLCIYAWKNFSCKAALLLGVVPLVVYFLFAFPFITSAGFYHLVLANPKQMMMFNVYIPVASLKVYLPFVALFIVYGRFFVYKKINNDLLDAFLGVVFSLFVLLIIPAPGWYVWMLPFLSVFFIKIYYPRSTILFFYLGFVATYLLFFIVFYRPDHWDLLFLGDPIDFKIYNERLGNFVFTLLDVFIFLTIYALYKFGIRSNAIYRRQSALVIGIGGDSGTGKTTLMADIKELLGDRVTSLEGDGDHRWERGDEHWKTFTHLNPKANYIHRQAEHLFLLKMGSAVAKVFYDHGTGKFTQPQVVTPKDFIILNGLHPFYLPKMRRLIDLKIYLDPDSSLRVHWKVCRDASTRGYTKETVFEQLEHRKIDTEKYIKPQREFADLVVHYFVKDPFEVGLGDVSVPIKLKLTLDSSVRLEQVIHSLSLAGCLVDWDYTDDLATQYVILNEPVHKKVLVDMVKQVMLNTDELLPQEPIWQDGYRGFVQFIILLLISEKMKEHELT